MKNNCLTCFQDITVTLNYIQLDAGIESTEIRRRLLFCVPDTVFHMVNNAIMCKSCYNVLNMAYEFISKCRSTNKQIFRSMQNTTMDQENKSLKLNMELHSKFITKKHDSEIVQLESNNNMQSGTEQLNKSSKFNNGYLENLLQDEIELHKSEISSYSENEHSISKLLEIKLEYDQESFMSEEVNGCTESEVSNVKFIENNVDLAFTQDRAKVTHDCFVKLKRLDIKHAQGAVKKVVKEVNANFASRYECDICDYKTSINSNFGRHMRIHNNDKPYTCDKCDYSTAVKSNLQSHLATHLNKKPYQCNKCEFNTAHQSNLKKHMYIHEDKTLIGDHREFVSTNKKTVKNHTSKHPAGKLYQCDKCKLNFCDKYKLDRHNTTIHSMEKKFKCASCEYSSVRKDTLMRHIKRKHQML